MEILYIAIGIIKGLIIAWLIMRRKASQKASLQREELLKQENNYIKEKSDLSHKLSVLEERASNLLKEKTNINVARRNMFLFLNFFFNIILCSSTGPASSLILA